MDTKTAWKNLSLAIEEMSCPSGDYNLKLQTVLAGVQLLFECPADEILDEIGKSKISTRALVSWLIFEGKRSGAVPLESVEELRSRYEATCPPGQGVLKAPPPGFYQ